MNVRHILFTMILLFSVRPMCAGYLAMGSYFDVWKVSFFEMAQDGTVIIREQIPLSCESDQVLASLRGNLAFAGAAITTSVFLIDKDKNVIRLDDVPTTYSNYSLTITPDCRFLIMNNCIAGEFEILESFIISAEEVRSTGYSLQCFPANDLTLGDMWVSKWGNTLVANTPNKEIAVLRIGSNGEIFDTGQRFNTDPNQANYGTALSCDGRTYVVDGAGDVSSFRIDENGTVTGPMHAVPGSEPPSWEPAITPDDRFVLQLCGWTSLDVFSIDEESYLTYTGHTLADFNVPQEVAITPDGNFALVGYPYLLNYMNLAAIRIHHDGSIELINETTIDGYLSDLQFIPPQVLFEFGIGGEWDDFTGWSTFDVAPQFTAPLFERLSSGTLAMAAPDNTNTFGSWQGPVDAGMVVPYSLYRLRYELKGHEPTPKNQMPSLRLRSNAQTFQQGDTLVIPSIGNAEFSPEPGQWTKYDMYFLAPISSCSRPEAQDDVFCSLDIINMDGDDDIGTTIELRQAFMDRIPVDCITTKTLLHEYHFTSGQQGWTNYSLPPQFDAPNFSWQSGSLVMQALSTNCYGSWDSNPGDTLTSTAAEVYRATFEISTDEPDRTKVPDLRFRLSLDDFSLNACQFIGSYSDSEMSPFYDSAYPNKTFKYALYFYKPASPTPHQLRLSIDLINLSTDNTPNATIYIHNVKLEKLELPPFPEDDYF